MRSLLILITVLVYLVPAAASAASEPINLGAPITASYFKILQPGESVTKNAQCPRDARWVVVSAYRAGKPGPLGHPQWDRRRTVKTWRGINPSGGRVAFNGRTFHNTTRGPVLVAGWCA